MARSAGPDQAAALIAGALPLLAKIGKCIETLVTKTAALLLRRWCSSGIRERGFPDALALFPHFISCRALLQTTRSDGEGDSGPFHGSEEKAAGEAAALTVVNERSVAIRQRVARECPQNAGQLARNQAGSNQGGQSFEIR